TATLERSRRSMVLRCQPIRSTSRGACDGLENVVLLDYAGRPQPRDRHAPNTDHLQQAAIWLNSRHCKGSYSFADFKSSLIRLVVSSRAGRKSFTGSELKRLAPNDTLAAATTRPFPSKMGAAIDRRPISSS